jgi:phosphatidylglycerophosphate synthase
MRPRELQDALNWYLYHPLAWQLAKRLARTPLTPNMVSVIGAMFVLGAALFYAQPPFLPAWPLSAAIGMALHMTWHVVDGADGDLARLTGKASPIGEMVDGICDYTSHIVLYLTLGWILSHALGGWGWALCVAAGFSHVVQSNHVEVQRRSYEWWVYDKPWLRVTHAQAGAATQRSGFGAIATGYLALASGVGGASLAIDAALAAASGNPARREHIRAIARDAAGPLLPVLKALGANPRAIVLGLSMLAGSPLWYFLYQTVVLNLLLVWSVRLQSAAARRMLARIEAG